MTGLIKSGSGLLESRVRPFAFAAATAPPPDPTLVALRERCLALEAALAERDTAIDELTERAEAAFREGEAAGEAKADHRRDEALDLLRQASDRASAVFAERLEAMDKLAAMLARTGLERLFGNADGRAEIVHDLIRHQIDALRGERAIEIRVSAQDFDAETAEGIDACCPVVISDALASGDCAIRLELGTIEAGIDQQWSELRAALSAMAGEGTA